LNALLVFAGGISYPGLCTGRSNPTITMGALQRGHLKAGRGCCSITLITTCKINRTRDSIFFCIAVEKPIVPDPSEPFGQHMLHDQMQEVLPFKGAITYVAGLAFNILKSHSAVLIGNDIFFH